MLYLKQAYNLVPAAPSTRDQFIEKMTSSVAPALEGEGARLVAGWFCHDEWYSQIQNVVEIDDWSALGALREASSGDGALGSALAAIDELAPERREELLEPAGPVATDVVHGAIEACAAEPVGVYTAAILEVAPGMLEPFRQALGAAAGALPIIAAWRDAIGNPNRIIDLWKGDIGGASYRPNDEGQEGFFGPLRQIAPREKVIRLHPLPYSPLR